MTGPLYSYCRRDGSHVADYRLVDTMDGAAGYSIAFDASATEAERAAIHKLISAGLEFEAERILDRLRAATNWADGQTDRGRRDISRMAADVEPAWYDL